MPAKYVPTEEELKLIMQYYAEYKTYAEVARRTGLSLVVVKRIIDENKTSCVDKRVNCLIYDDAFIPDEPKEKQIKDFNKQLEDFYKEVILNGGIL